MKIIIEDKTKLVRIDTLSPGDVFQMKDSGTVWVIINFEDTGCLVPDESLHYSNKNIFAMRISSGGYGFYIEGFAPSQKVIPLESSFTVKV